MVRKQLFHRRTYLRQIMMIDLPTSTLRQQYKAKYSYNNKYCIPLHKIASQRISTFMYKLINNLLPMAMGYIMIGNNDIHQCNTREKHQWHGARPTLNGTCTLN